MKKMKKKNLCVWIIEDDEDTAGTYRRTLSREFKGIKIRTFEFPIDAVDCKAKIKPDYIFYDMTRGLLPIGWDITHLTRCDIDAIYETFPNATIAVYSAMNEVAKDVVDEMIEEQKERGLFLVHASYRPKGWIELIKKGEGAKK